MHKGCAAFAFLAATTLLNLANAHAEPFFGGSRASSLGTFHSFYAMPAPRVYAETAMYVPPAPRHEQPVFEDRDDALQIESSGSQPTVSGSRAVLRRGIAYAPSQAPENVKHAIWAVNALRNKPYKWGGGHGSFFDSGYDCSGTVSFALHYAGLLDFPIPSSEFHGFGQRGRGRWITVYSRRGHAFAIIAGLRLDTTNFRTGADEGPRWRADGRDTWGFEARHPAGL